MEINEKSLLLIEDERPLALAVVRILARAGWHVVWVNDGVKGLETALSGDFALVMLDVLLPGKNGWEICRELRAARPDALIMMLTAMDQVEDKVKGLRMGADDYVAKPFEIEELVARVEALLRRDKSGRQLVTKIADLELDRKDRTVRRQGHTIPLNRREYDLLEALASNAGQPISKATLQARVWTDDETFDNTVDSFVASLRQKIDLPFGRPLLHGTLDGAFVLGE